MNQETNGATPDVAFDASSPRLQKVLGVLERTACTGVPVLLRGESGTGKSMLARWLHSRSSRASQPFVVVNCPTLSAELLASELFGHARGAFTDAVRDQPGIVEAANGGTLFLDEISEIPPSVQAKLLRFLQDKEFERVGESLTRHADVRIVAATNRNLETAVEAGSFRSDLMYRLNVIEVSIPPLRERPEDIPPLIRTIIALLCGQMGRGTPSLSAAAEQLLLAYDWPGNVRELRNVIERALVPSPGDILERKAFPRRIRELHHKELRPGDDVTIDALVRDHIERILSRAPSVAAAARILGIDESTLRRKCRRYQTRLSHIDQPSDGRNSQLR